MKTEIYRNTFDPKLEMVACFMTYYNADNELVEDKTRAQYGIGKVGDRRIMFDQAMDIEPFRKMLIEEGWVVKEIVNHDLS